MHHLRGFTLIELLVSVTIACILILFAHHNFSHWRKNQQAYRTSLELQHMVHFARAYAISNRRPLTFCGSLDKQSCANDWSDGALLFEDANRNGLVDNADRVIKYVPLSLKNAQLTWKGFTNQRLIFESMGITSASNGTFTYCELDKDPRYSRQAIVSRGGRARLSKDKNGDGFHEDSNGNLINCPN